MKVAYLVGQYPKTSHTFIRREIAALEQLGIEVQRFSARRVGEPLVDPDDRAESARTRVILESSAIALLAHTLLCALTRPGKWFAALLLTIRMGWRSERGLMAYLAYVAEACALVNWMKQTGVQHLHAHFATNATAIALLAAKLGGPPFSFTVHGPEVMDSGPSLSLRRKVRDAVFVVAISYNARAYLWRYADIADWNKIHVVHCGLDTLYLERPAVPLPEHHKLICVARLDAEKGHFVLLHAAARLIKEGLPFTLELVGDGPLRREIEQEVARLGLERHVSLMGWLGSAEVRSRLESSSLFVLPSFSEGLPVVFMEALAVGRPVIATYIAGVPELIVEGENGWLVPASNVDELARAIREALVSPHERLQRMAMEGRSRVLAQHDVNIEARKLAAYFRDARPDGARLG